MLFRSFRRLGALLEAPAVLLEVVPVPVGQDRLHDRLHLGRRLRDLGLQPGDLLFRLVALDVAFQGFNAWHSFQYLGLTYYINRLRHEKGEIGTKFIDKMSNDGDTWKFYFFNVGLTASAVGVIATLIYFKDILGLTFDQCYYIVVLSFLLMHYLHDHLFFTKPEEILLQ